MQIVTKDVQAARRIICSGTRTARAAKREAHRRQRARNRSILRDLERGGDEDRDFRARPVTGWDVA